MNSNRNQEIQTLNESAVDLVSGANRNTDTSLSIPDERISWFDWLSVEHLGTFLRTQGQGRNSFDNGDLRLPYNRL